MAEVLITLIATLWLETRTLVSDLLSLVQHDAREIRAQVELVAEYKM